MADALLEVNQIEVVYGNVVRAVQGISLRVMPDSIVAMIGLNGAGKTTTLRAISGFMASEKAAVREGEIRVRGDDVTGLRPDVMSRRGVSIVPEWDKVFSTLSVQENLEVGARLHRQIAGEGPGVTLGNVFDLFPMLEKHRRTLAVFLSGGERQLLAIATALLARPQLLLIDEMSLGLSPMVHSLVVRKLCELKRSLGIALFLVDQNAESILDVADYGYVMENGMIVRDGDARSLLEHSDVREFYLGKSEFGTDEERHSYRDVKQYKRTRRWWE